MRKKLAAALTIAIFVLSTFAIMTPAQAHFTLGQLEPSYRFHSLDFDPHVSGVIGYVFPGGGLAAYTGVPNGANVVQSPGYQTPYPCRLGGEPLGTGAFATGTNIIPNQQCNPAGAPTSSWYQLQGSAYAPFGAVLTSSTGDLIFALNATAQTNVGGQTNNGLTTTGTVTTTLGGTFPPNDGDRLGWSGVTIFLPPGFTLPTMDGSNVVTTVTNNYANIQVYKVSPYDRYAPGWTAVNIWTDGGKSSYPNNGCTAGAGSVGTSCSYYNHQFLNFTTAGEWYYFRINQVTAPNVAGRYFFKVLLSGDSNYIAGREGTATNQTAGIAYGFTQNPPTTGEAPTQFIPTQNWPVLLVKGEIDPAIITGTVRYAGYNSTLYGQPVQEAGQVWAHMEDKIDPYTGQQITMCPAVGQPMVPGCTDARGYYNGTVITLGTASTTSPTACVGGYNTAGVQQACQTHGAAGHYEVEGVAPGVYTIYAEAAGFPQQVCASGVTVLKGQSLHFDCYVQPGPVIHGNIYTKHQFGDEPWMGEIPECTQTQLTFCSTSTYNEYIKIELYDAPTLSNIPDPSANIVSWTPLPCVAGGQDLFYPKQHAGSCGDPRMASAVAFPWHEYTPINGYGNCNGSPLAPLMYYQVSKSGNPRPGCTTPLNIFNSAFPDPQGVGPAQHWFVQGGTTIPFHFEMGVKSEYGAPRDLDGQVPQVYATWVNGLTPGRYYVRAWVFRYVQTALDGTTFQEYYFDVTPQEWAGDVTLPLDLRLSSWVNKTVHFHDQFNSLIEDPINTGGGFMTGYLTGADGNIYSYNQTALGLTCYPTTINGLAVSAAVWPTPLCSDSFGNPSGISSGANCVVNAGCYAVAGEGSGWKVGDPIYGGYSSTFTHGTAAGYSGITSGYDQGSGVCYDPRGLIANGVGVASLCGGGVNSNAIQEGRGNIQFWGINDTWSGENYGIPSGTYTPATFVLGYIPQGPLEQVSVTLSGTVTSISDHMIRGPGFNVTIFSIDWERPTVNRAWEFGNPEGWNFIPGGGFAGGCGSPATGFVSGSSRTGFVCSNNVGAEIDLGAYANGSLADWLGDEPSAVFASSIDTTGLFQNQFENNITAIGGGFPIHNLAGNLFDANFTWFGSEVRRLEPGGLLGASTWSGGQPFLACQSLTVCNFHNVNGLFNWPHQLEPTAFKPGQYDFGAYTYGYVQDQGFSVYADVAQIADVRLNLVIGVNITLDILFKKEHVITPTDFNMSGRVRIFNDQGQLVGEWMSSSGAYTPPNNLPLPGANSPNGIALNGRAFAADGTVRFPFGPLSPVVPGIPASGAGGPGAPGSAQQQVPPVGSGLNEYNFIPGGITELHVPIAGLSQTPAAGVDAPPALPAGTYMGDPVFTPSACDFELDCYAGGYMMGSGHGGGTGVSGMAMGYPFPNTGIAGYPDYQGGWTAEVDFVPWYNNNTNTPETSAGQCTGGVQITCQSRSSLRSFGQYYTPVQGLLLGESYHIIPGTTATSGISLTEDAALSSTFLGHSMVFNHLGPYSQEGVWQISGTHLSGEASGIFEVDLNGFISGTALAFTWANDFRPLSWATVSVTGANGATWNYYTNDGAYGMYLPGGSYSLTIASPGIASQTLSVAVTGGESGTAGNVYMQQSNIPVPEFSGIAVIAFAALAASLYVLQRRRRK